MRLPPPLALALGVAVHAAFFLSVFDVYFRSPVDADLLSRRGRGGSKAVVEELCETHQEEGTAAAAARRVVLVVADGLRADVCFAFAGRDGRFRRGAGKHARYGGDDEAHGQAARIMWPRDKESFLRWVMETRGGWGVAHTRVPTETRPGHVALIGGLYEDVSAVTRGWQANPVPFDHVFRNARHTFAWGHEDVTGLFARDEVSKGKITQVFPPHQEDFGDKNLSSMDVWVFNRVSEFLKRDNDGDGTMRNQSAVVFFLHLGAIDANGHAFRPHSHEYFDNTALVDRGLAGLYDLFETAFHHDGRTAYIFSSDHGMSARGAHGDGHPDNTRTPFVAWGAGITGPQNVSQTLGHDIFLDGTFTLDEELHFTREWGLDHLRRRDLEQADVAPLIATLLGIPIPAHSVGLLPLQYLHPGPHRARAVLCNAKQLVTQVASKEDARKQRTLFWRFQPSHDLAHARALLSRALGEWRAGNSSAVESLCVDISGLCRKGMRYYQVYDRPLLMSSVALGYLGFVLLALETVLWDDPAIVEEQDKPEGGSSGRGPALVSAYERTLAGVSIGLGLVVLLLLVEQAPVQHAGYPFVSLCLWVMLWRTHGLSRRARVRVVERYVLRSATWMSLGFVVCETLVLVAGYSVRWCLTVLMVMEGVRPAAAARTPRTTGVWWLMGCVLLGGFTFMDLDSNPNVWLMLVSGGVACGVVAWETKRVVVAWWVPLALLVAAKTDISLAQSAHGEKLAWYWQALAWVTFMCAPVVCWYVKRSSSFQSGRDADADASSRARLALAFSALVTQYVLLSVNFEVLFLVCLYVLMLQWWRQSDRKGDGDLFGTGSTFLAVSNVAFFATGNFVSMASFQLSSTFRFSSVYNPFLMAVLLVYKVMIPYLLVMVTTVEKVRRSPGGAAINLFLVVICQCDLLAVTLFFLVRDEGSWLDIGNSISQYGFACAHLVFVPVMYAVCARWVPQAGDY